MDNRFLSDIGTRLKLSREKRGLSLEQVFEITRIQPAILKEIEEGTSTLSPVLLKGFVKTYAETLGWDTKDFFKKPPDPSETKTPQKKTPRHQNKKFVLQYGLALFFVCLVVGFGLTVFLKGPDSTKANKGIDSAHLPLTKKDESLKSTPTHKAAVSSLNKPSTDSLSRKQGLLSQDTREDSVVPVLPSNEKKSALISLSQQIRRGDFTEEILIFSPKTMDIYFTTDDQAVVTKTLKPSVLFAIKARHKIYLRFDENLEEVSLFHNGRFFPIPLGDFFEKVFP